jgi:hypothetical protein
MPVSPISPDLITVGYISRTAGYVRGLSVSDANAYAKLNPETVFIFVDGDNKVRYLSINQVNQLTTKDLLRSDTCSTTPRPCGPPAISFYGGAGVGALANPVIDANGSIIAVDLVSGGYGYENPPFVQVYDPCNNGSGAVLDTEIKDGTVIKVIVVDGGTGYLPPPQTVPQYPAIVKLEEVIVKNPGINYNCGVDRITVCIDRDGEHFEEPNGTVLAYNCDPFGKIRSVTVVNGGNFTEVPRICIESETGLNAKFTPVFRVIRDPLIPEVAKDVVQVYDLVGLNVNGYVGGKAYYGNVYYQNGIRYAGTPNTGGTPIRVYDTRQESIPQ